MYAHHPAQGWLKATDASKMANDSAYRAACRCRDIQREHWAQVTAVREKKAACHRACEASAEYAEAERLRRLAEGKAKEVDGRRMMKKGETEALMAALAAAEAQLADMVLASEEADLACEDLARLREAEAEAEALYERIGLNDAKEVAAKERSTVGYRSLKSGMSFEEVPYRTLLLSYRADWMRVCDPGDGCLSLIFTTLLNASPCALNFEPTAI